MNSPDSDTKTHTARTSANRVVVGIGNPLLKDDRAGIEVVEALERAGTSVDTAILYSVGFDVLDSIYDYNEAVIIDACQLGKPPGTILEITPEALFASDHLVTSHAVTLGATLKTGQLLFPERMPDVLSIILIEAKDITCFSSVCSEETTRAVGKVVDRLGARFGTGQPRGITS